MQIGRFLAALYVTAVADAAVAPLLRVGTIEPIFLALLACVVISRGGRKAFLATGVVGLTSDLLGPGRIGIDAAIYLVVGFALSQTKRRPGIEHPLAHTALAWLAISLLALCIGTTRWLAGEVPIAWTGILGRSLGVGAYSAALGLPVFMVSGWIESPARRRRTAEII
jgi:rod shape-determining protein MreD